jgi:hypothetical protein
MVQGNYKGKRYLIVRKVMKGGRQDDDDEGEESDEGWGR